MNINIGKQAFYHFLSQIGFSISGFIATFAIARILGAEGVGIYALGLSLLVFVNLPVSGIGDATVKRISEGREKGQYFSLGLLLNIIVAIFASVIIVLFRDILNSYTGGEIALLVVGVAICRSPFQTLKWTLQGEGKVAYSGWVRTIERTLRTALQVILLLLGYKIFGLFLGYMASLLLGALMSVAVIEIKPKFPRRRHLESLFSYAKYGWSNALKGTTFNWMDTIVLGVFVTPSFVGIYEVAWTLSTFLLMASNSLSSALFPEISRLEKEGEIEKIKSNINDALVFAGVLLIPGFFGAAILGEEILSIYSAEFSKGQYVLLILISALTFNAYFSQLTSAMRGLDKPDVALKIDFVFVGSNMILNVVLVYLFGWHGAAVATLISSFISLAVGYYAISGLIGRPGIPRREITKEVISGGTMFLVILFLNETFESNIFVTVLLVIVGAVIYWTTLLTISVRIRRKVFGLLPETISKIMPI